MSSRVKHYVTAAILAKEASSGEYSVAQRNYLVRLNARLPQIGQQIGTKVSKIHVACCGSAMPISFTVPVYGISRQKFAAMLRHQTKLPAITLARR